MSISYEEFVHACQDLIGHFQRTGPCEWSSLALRTQYGVAYLSIKVHVTATSSSQAIAAESTQNIGRCAAPEDTHEDIEELIEMDHEAMQQNCSRTEGHQQRANITVVYDIVYSSSYQVPVLYLCLRDSEYARAELPHLDRLYEALVPEAIAPQMRDSGILGALSFADHPITGVPTYFVHPCQMLDAMCAVGASNVSSVEYLLLWFGLVGKNVGLNVPTQLAAGICAESSSGEERTHSS